MFTIDNKLNSLMMIAQAFSAALQPLMAWATDDIVQKPMLGFKHQASQQLFSHWWPEPIMTSFKNGWIKSRYNMVMFTIIWLHPVRYVMTVIAGNVLVNVH